MAHQDSPSDAESPSGILKRLIDATISVTTAGDQLAHHAIGFEGGVESLWSLLIQAAKDHVDHHDKLVSVFAHISRLPQVPRADGQPLLIYEMRVWRDMPQLGWQMNYEWNTLTVPLTPPAERQKVIDGFINVNKLCAKLMTTRQVSFNYSMFALWTFRAALETPPHQTDPQHSPIQAFLPAAAAWIDILGDEICTWNERLAYGGKNGDPGRNGPLCPENHGFDHERWSFWRARFGQIAGGEYGSGAPLDEGLRTVARLAHDRMAHIEENSIMPTGTPTKSVSRPGLGIAWTEPVGGLWTD